MVGDTATSLRVLLPLLDQRSAGYWRDGVANNVTKKLHDIVGFINQADGYSSQPGDRTGRLAVKPAVAAWGGARLAC